jgi:hypothetical protein
MRVGKFVDQLLDLLASGKINRDTEVVLIVPNGPEAMYWRVKGERDGPLAALAMWMVKGMLNDPRAFHSWLAGIGEHVGLDGHSIELRLRSGCVPLLVHDNWDRPEPEKPQLPSGTTEPRPLLSAGQAVVPPERRLPAGRGIARRDG